MKIGGDHNSLLALPRATSVAFFLLARRKNRERESPALTSRSRGIA